MKGSISAKNVNDIVLKETISTIEKIAANSNKTVQLLEIGSGAGAFITNLKEQLEARNLKFELQSGDIEPDQINSRNLGITCQFLDAQQEFNLGKKYDVIIAIEIIEHIENPFHFVREIARHLNPGGEVIITSPNILSLRSRFRYFTTGCYDYFRRPYNEYWLNMGHVNPINPLQLIYMFRKNGFAVKDVLSNAAAFESILLLPLALLVALFTFIHYTVREKGKQQKNRNRQLLKFVLSPAMLLGKIAIYKFSREKDIIANPDVWHRGDDNFLP